VGGRDYQQPWRFWGPGEGSEPWWPVGLGPVMSPVSGVGATGAWQERGRPSPTRAMDLVSGERKCTAARQTLRRLPNTCWVEKVAPGELRTPVPTLSFRVLVLLEPLPPQAASN
jgi:hypothetical protein